MFDNIGNKIKILATVIAIVGVLGGLITGIILIDELGARGFLIGLGSAVILLFSSWIIYAFGKLVDDVGAIREQLLSATPTQEESLEDELPIL
ncbi:MAG: hypothetical protein FWE69_05345 [Clostridiales bacterium]|nr:hypothetical protein [Clostridiales bacterium]